VELRTDYTYANMSKPLLIKINLKDADLSNEDWSDTRLHQANLTNTNLSGATLNRIGISVTDSFNTNFSDANLEGARFWRVGFIRPNFTRANLSHSKLSSLRLYNANFTHVNLTNSTLKGVSFMDANCSNANFSNAQMDRVCFTNCTMQNANFDSITYSDKSPNFLNARRLHTTLNIPTALTQETEFQAATTLSWALEWAESGDIPSAIKAFQDAQAIVSYSSISHTSWRLLCWSGYRYGYSEQVRSAVEDMVDDKTGSSYYSDVRGLARALAGDFSGAIADFQCVLRSRQFLELLNDFNVMLQDDQFPELTGNQQRRERWIEALQQNQNPFTPGEVQKLLKEEGIW